MYAPILVELDVSGSFVEALAAEIDGIEAELSADPRFIKLNELKRLRELYSQENARTEVNVLQRLKFPTPARAYGGRTPSPERQGILDAAKAYLVGRNHPTPTSEIYDAIRGSVNIPGTNPKNNLSAMLSNSTEFQSHGRVGWTLTPKTPEASGDLLTRSAPEASMSSPASPAGEPSNVRPVDPAPGGGT